MKLRMLKEWMDTLPEEYMDYNCVYSVYEDSKEGEEGKWTRSDELITSCSIDKGHTECSFSRTRPEALCVAPSQTKPVEKQTSKKKPTKKKPSKK
jgi:hypothetical protein